VPVGFLTDSQTREYGRFAGEPTPDQLARHFHLDDADRAFVAEHRGDHNRLGVAVQLGSLRLLGTLLDDPAVVPASAVRFAADQLSITDSAELMTTYTGSAGRWRHGPRIRERYGYRAFADFGIAFRLRRPTLASSHWCVSTRRRYVAHGSAGSVNAQSTERKLILRITMQQLDAGNPVASRYSCLRHVGRGDEVYGRGPEADPARFRRGLERRRIRVRAQDEHRVAMQRIEQHRKLFAGAFSFPRGPDEHRQLGQTAAVQRREHAIGESRCVRNSPATKRGRRRRRSR
jgi:Domain of unknown function (DUF4158)